MKNILRKKVINIRKNTSIDFVNNSSYQIVNKVLSLNQIKSASTIMIYLDFNNEVKTDYLAIKLMSLGKKVLVPITKKESKILIPSEIKDLSSELKIGTYGIREPKEEFIRECSLNSINVLIVPGVAFDKNKYRLGYGGGFYDRFIEKLHKDTVTIGLAFDFQVFDCIPKENHDSQLDYVITERQIIK
ncbi:5-formyltetrahydrofolate cyclo-ligase [Paraclostridium sordellii]|uniref:5-formyltetrahydrofolate cyclo-ligase n=1 Tax=Paraclostridium sordellii TaxID=1505 RepID=UPI0005E66B16|nr:5-formyltetrahydrofolate cyclo-ligase [Paeniclostridium sordellii]CEN25901.1 5-formyltetrahydrofolate cyclo-ligase [[Clostridium] sordellii] [Paeniclostridium sordellii]